jgi:hypothetical protein
LVFFFIPETQFYRPSKAQTPSIQSDSGSGNEAPPTQKDVTSVEHAQPVGSPVKKSFLQQLNPWSGLHPGGGNASFLSLVVRSWPLVVYPAVFFATLNFGFGVAAVLCFVDVAPAVFQSPPYSMSPGVQSLIIVPYCIGGALGTVVAGRGTDLYCRYRASKNNGVFEPENRLIMVPFLALFTSAGLLMSGPSPKKTVLTARYGWGISKHSPWPLPWIGGALIAFGHCGIPTITMSYGTTYCHMVILMTVVVDCYYPVGPEALQLVIGLKQVIGFGFSYAVTPWQALFHNIH